MALELARRTYSYDSAAEAKKLLPAAGAACCCWFTSEYLGIRGVVFEKIVLELETGH